MNILSALDRRPIILAIAGPNGAGKTTLYHSHLKFAALPYVNTDVVADELDMEPYPAARLTESMRRSLVEQKSSFIFETVFSDPMGAKLTFLKKAGQSGYEVVLCYIRISSAKTSDSRVALRISQGGHDVPQDNVKSRFPRILKNLERAIQELPNVWIFDNENLGAPFRKVAVFQQGQPTVIAEPVPQWLEDLLWILRTQRSASFNNR